MANQIILYCFSGVGPCYVILTSMFSRGEIPTGHRKATLDVSVYDKHCRKALCCSHTLVSNVWGKNGISPVSCPRAGSSYPPFLKKPV